MTIIGEQVQYDRKMALTVFEYGFETFLKTYGDVPGIQDVIAEEQKRISLIGVPTVYDILTSMQPKTPPPDVDDNWDAAWAAWKNDQTNWARGFKYVHWFPGPGWQSYLQPFPEWKAVMEICEHVPESHPAWDTAEEKWDDLMLFLAHVAVNVLVEAYERLYFEKQAAPTVPAPAKPPALTDKRDYATEEDRAEHIRELIKNTSLSNPEIADLVGVTRQDVWQIRKRMGLA